MKLVKLIANLGYGSRKQVLQFFHQERITNAAGDVLKTDDVIESAQIRIDGAALDPPTGLCVILHKPCGYTCSHKDVGPLIYDLLPPRFRLRRPTFTSVGRLDRDTSGLLLMTDEGALVQRLTAPKTKIKKIYEVTLARDLRGDEVACFASGTLMLTAETTPLAAADLEIIHARQARLTLIEGRYHQVRRMFAAVGNHVESLHRSQLGHLTLGDLQPGQWRVLDAADRAAVFG